MSALTQREEAFMATIEEWMGGENNEVYLAGSTRGPIHLDEEGQRFDIREDQALSENLINALIENGVKDARVTGDQTLNLLNEMATNDFSLALNEAANERLDDGESDSYAPGMH